jgi:hypothetical protein
MNDLLSALVSNTAALALVLGLFSPWAVAAVTQSHWSKTEKTAASVIVSVIVAVGSLLVDGKLGNVGDVFQTLLIVLTTAEATYQKLWKPTGVAGAIESATSPASSVDPDFAAEAAAADDEPAGDVAPSE